MPEIFGSASYYGIGKILKQYSNFPVCLPLPVNVQHGIVGRKVSEHDALQGAPENWYWDRETCEFHISAFPGVKGRKVGAPFLYLLQYINYSKHPMAQRSGTIVFPSHSSAFVKVSADFSTFADQLNELPEKYHPITVCAYHIDFERGDYQPFIDRGFKIVTNGNSIYDTTFLYNFIDNVKDKRFSIANHISTSLYLSSAMGVVSCQMGPTPDFDNKDPHLIGVDLNKEEQRDLDEFARFFPFPDEDYKIQQKFVAEMLGQDYLLSPEEMKKLLWRNVVSIKYVIGLFKFGFITPIIFLKRFLRTSMFPRFKKSG